MNIFLIPRTSSMLCIALIVSACGGGSDDIPPKPEVCYKTRVHYCPTSAWGDPFGLALFFAWYGGACTEVVDCAKNLPATDLSQGVIRDEFIATNWTSTNAQEKEPNNTFDTAYPTTIGSHKGFLITGEVGEFVESSDSSSSPDIIDYIVLAAETSDLMSAYLCPSVDQCTQPFYSGEEIYIELFDQNRILLESTRTMPSSGHIINFSAISGLRYYVSVNVNLTTDKFPYKLVITD